MAGPGTTNPGPADPVRSVEVFACAVPLPRPLRVGGAVVSRRHYAVVRIQAASGLEGVGYAFGRGLPVARIISESLAPVLVGADARLPEQVRQQLAGVYWPYAEQGLFPVAASAVDLALWDMLGRRLGAPLADLLGRRQETVPLCAVGGYAVDGDGSTDLDALQREMAGYRQRGFRAVKLAVGHSHPADDARRVAAVREVMGAECAIGVDAFRSFSCLDDALRRVRLLAPYDIAFVEDPFPDSLAPLAAELRRRTGVSVALGENTAGHRAYRDLIAAGAVDVVRCDATVVGGVREFMAAAAVAGAHGLELSPHVHPEVHVHFGAAISNLYHGGLEYMEPAAGLDGFHRLLRSQLEVSGGVARVPDRPGLGLDMDWDAVRRFAGG